MDPKFNAENILIVKELEIGNIFEQEEEEIIREDEENKI